MSWSLVFRQVSRYVTLCLLCPQPNIVALQQIYSLGLDGSGLALIQHTDDHLVCWPPSATMYCPTSYAAGLIIHFALVLQR